MSSKIAKMFRRCGFVNVDYLVANKIYVSPSRILNVLTRDWRRWVKPLCMLDGGGIDPPGTFGYETAGTFTRATWDYIAGSKYPCPDSGIAQSITVLLRYADGLSKCAIYDSSLNLVTNAETEEKNVSTDGIGEWITFNFTDPKPDLVAADYWLVAWSNNSAEIRYDTGGEAEQAMRDHVIYNGFPSSITPDDYYAYKDSIYCTYTPKFPYRTIKHTLEF